MSIELESPGTPPIEIITSSNPNDFMQDTNEQPQPTTSTTHLQHSPGLPSCSYTPPKGIMKSSPKKKIVEKIWKSPGHDEVTILGESSTEDFPVQPPIKQIEVVFLDSSENTQNTGTQDETTNQAETPAITGNELTSDNPNANTDEERAPLSTSPTKSSISSIHPNDFYNPDEF